MSEKERERNERAKNKRIVNNNGTWHHRVDFIFAMLYNERSS